MIIRFRRVRFCVGVTVASRDSAPSRVGKSSGAVAITGQDRERVNARLEEFEVDTAISSNKDRNLIYRK